MTWRSAADLCDRNRGWGEAPSWSQRQRVEQTLALVPEGVSSVLDVGCGDGALDLVLCTEVLDHLPVDVYPQATPEEHCRETQEVPARCRCGQRVVFRPAGRCGKGS